jgi:hypothetical protein
VADALNFCCEAGLAGARPSDGQYAQPATAGLAGTGLWPVIRSGAASRASGALAGAPSGQYAQPATAGLAGAPSGQYAQPATAGLAGIRLKGG